ncbi:MAG: peptide chain release factor N(5)-glutamine methyltransferase [Dermatophilaceae bacterium]
MSTPVPSVYAAVMAARATLARAGIASAEADAIELAAFVLAVPTGEVRRRMVLRDNADPTFLRTYAALLAEREARVPLQHLTGRAYFRRLTLAVGPGVFVPRPETEVVAGLAIEAARAAVQSGIRHPVVVDLCTGSGAIALAVKDEVPGAEVVAVELSPQAHAWAARNRDLLALDIRLDLADATTALDDLAGHVDVVVTNPPYIPDGQVPVDPEVRDHDPGLALYGRSADGLAIPLRVAARAAALLGSGGVLVMEHADVQGRALLAALADAGVWRDLTDHRDLTGRPRAVVARRGHGE